MRHPLVIAALLAGLWLGPRAWAQSDPAELALIASEKLSAAHQMLADAQRAGDRVAALTQTIQAYEEGLGAMREGLRQAALREDAIRREFDAESETLSQLLGVLTSIRSAPGPLVLLHPSGALGTARSGMVVAEVTPAIQKKVDALRGRLDEAALLRALQQSAADTLQTGLNNVQTARTELSQAISNRTDLPRQFLSDPAQIDQLIAGSETLQGFASGLVALDVGGSVEDPIRDFTAARGTLPLPATGAVLRRFNQPDAAGILRPGLTLATRPRALVTAPWPATIRFAGPLLDYGNVMILEPDAGILLILAGLDVVYGEIGEVLVPQSPVGSMGGAAPDPETFLLEAVNGTGSQQTETLYIELRIAGEPVDPAEWFAATKE